MKISRLLFLSLLTLWTRVIFADANSTISAAEYFVDTDPGEGSGTALTAQDGAFDSEVEAIAPVDFNVTGLSVGPHLIGIRYKDNNNTWGEVLYQTIHVYDANPSGSGSGGSGGGGSGGASGGFASISAAEYFVDTDPGAGSGIAFQAKDGAFDSEVESILPKDLNVTGLSVGPHLVGVRYKDNNNTWGEVLYQTIHVYDANPSGSGSGGSGGGGSGGASGGFASISAAEYFVDTDPGAGSGIAFQAKDGAFDSEVESILPKDLNVTGLSVGPHLVGVRYKDNNNTWGEVLYQTIHVYDANPDINNGGSGGSGGTGGFTVIAGAEYFIGNDPGEGNATALQPKDGAFDSEVESTLTASLSLNGYALGTYLVGVRYMDNNGTWGDVLFKTIEVDVDTDGDGLADKAEDFYETNATIQDTDGDGYLDGEEVAFGSNPKDANSLGNRAPTSLFTSNTLSILENLPAGEFLAEFNATDGESNSTFTYSLADATGSGGNAFFSIDANGTLRTAAVLDYEANSSHTVRVRVSDQHNYFLDKNFTIQVQDMDEGTAPTLGDGSEENPYQIHTLAHLKWLSFSDSVWENKHFIQTSDINATETKTWANGYGFRPIGHNPGTFKGNYDGRGFQIQNLFIYRPSETRPAGLFSSVHHSDLKNIRILDANITGRDKTGGLAGTANQNTVIENCSFDGTIIGSGIVGGLVGRNMAGQIRKSFSEGNFKSSNEFAKVGGLVGYNTGAGSIVDSYSKANVSGRYSIGGIAGRAQYGSIIRTYSTGVVDYDDNQNRGGLIGSRHTATISSSFWDINSSGVTTSAGGTGAMGKSTAEMMDPSTFLDAGWDFNASGGTWKMTAGQTYPRLAWENTPTTLPYDLNSTTPLQVLENQPLGTVVGHFTAKHLDVPSELRFGLVNKSGLNPSDAMDNHFFNIDTNGTLRTAVILDHEANATFTIHVKVRDHYDQWHQREWVRKIFTVQVVNEVEDFDGDGIEDAYDPDNDNDGFSNAEEIAYGSNPWDAKSIANASPTDLTLSNHTILENQPAGTFVGQLTGSDPDAKSTLDYSRVLGPGDQHNSYFVIDQNRTLRTQRSFDYESDDHNLSVRIRVRDEHNASLVKIFTIALLDMNDSVVPPITDHNQTKPPGDGNGTTPPDHNQSIAPLSPIVQTGNFSSDVNGTYRFEGKILSGDYANILEAGIRITPADSNATQILPADLNGTDGIIIASTNNLTGGRTYFYRAYALTTMGESLGTIRRIEVSDRNDNRHWWSSIASARTDGWIIDSWMGDLLPYPNQWAYHRRLGWIFMSPDGNQGYWLWRQENGWLWANSSTWPFLWSHQSTGWLYLLPVKNQALFYDYGNGSLK